jgi:hypothetical protein
VDFGPLPHEAPLDRLPRLAQRDQRLQQLGDALRRRGCEGRGDLGRHRRVGQPARRAATPSGLIGITTYLRNGCTIEHAQQIANHESPRTTKLYGRTNHAISLDEIERIQLRARCKG